MTIDPDIVRLSEQLALSEGVWNDMVKEKCRLENMSRLGALRGWGHPALWGNYDFVARADTQCPTGYIMIWFDT